MKINQYIEDVQKQFPAKVSRITLEGREVYLKRNIEKKVRVKRFMNLVQGFIANVIGIKTLAPTANTRELSTHEADKIKRIREAGIDVPEIHFSCPEYFIMEECGVRLKDVVKEQEGRRGYYLREAIKSLSHLHNHGFAHGGSQIRNFTVKDGRVFMIDFEERIQDKYLSAIQFRDVLVFLISVASLKMRDIDYHTLLKTYEKHSASQDSMLTKVLDLSQRFSFMRSIAKSRAGKFLGKDFLFISYLVEELSFIKRTQG